jgi:hypothetical protein
MSMVGFPLLLIPVAIYNIIAFLMPGVHFEDPLVKLTLMSGTEWPVTLSDILLALGVLMLMFEVIKGARPGAKYLMDHLLSLIVFGAAAAEFVLWSRFGTSTYFLLALLALVDFLSGIALRTRRSALAASAPAARKSARKFEKIETPVVEPQFEPTPTPASAPAPVAAPATTSSVPAAASVAESVLLDHPAPAAAPPVVAASSASASSAASAASSPSPEVPSPGLQPGHSVPPSPDAPR